MAWLEALVRSLVHAAVRIVALLALLAALLLPRLLWVVARPPRTPRRTAPAKTALVLGSGGHTTEILMLLSTLDPRRYRPRTYVVSSGDGLSATKAREHEEQWAGSPADEHEPTFAIVTLPRARNVHQSWLSTPLSTLLSFFACLRLVVRGPRRTAFADVVMMNGPGTCVPLVAAVYVNRILGLASPKLVYVESFARVRSLSLTARILRPFVDVFVVQWPQAAQASRSGVEYKGWLV
ncbi:unnamed protein product [Parajaminaea phylloscopi]